jgi:hypothetical protein
LDLLRALQIREVTPSQYLHINYSEPIFVQLNSPDLYVHPTLTQWDTQHFYKHHGEYKSQFKGYAERTDLLVNGIYWTEDLPRLFETGDTRDPEKFAPTVIGWSRRRQSPCEPFAEDSVDVMSVGNLPNELPKDASEEFGEMLLQHVIPELMLGNSRLIEEATIAKGGNLTAHFSYLSDFVAESPE